MVVSLQEKLNIRCVHHFNLVLQNMKNNTGTAAKMTLLQEHETLAEVRVYRAQTRFRTCLQQTLFRTCLQLTPLRTCVFVLKIMRTIKDNAIATN